MRSLARSPADTARRATVVVVDDDADLREALQFLLEVEGFTVATCDSGEALLELDLPDGQACLVLDYHLGGMSGMDALENLRGRGVELPAIMITSDPSSTLRARAKRWGARMVEKPLLGDTLIGAIRALV
ncbi:MAG: response regulator [Phenylobacterium sp.]